MRLLSPSPLGLFASFCLLALFSVDQLSGLITVHPTRNSLPQICPTSLMKQSPLCDSASQHPAPTVPGERKSSHLGTGGDEARQ